MTGELLSFILNSEHVKAKLLWVQIWHNNTAILYKWLCNTVLKLFICHPPEAAWLTQHPLLVYLFFYSSVCFIYHHESFKISSSSLHNSFLSFATVKTFFGGEETLFPHTNTENKRHTANATFVKNQE